MTDYTRKVDIVKDSANVANKKKIVYVDASSDTTVTAGAVQIITVQPPNGKIWRVVSFTFRVNPPSGAASGTHNLKIHLTVSSDWAPELLSATYSSTLRITDNIVATGNRFVDSDVALINLLTSVKFSYNYPLYLFYTNNTDVDQTNERQIYLLLEEEDEAE